MNSRLFNTVFAVTMALAAMAQSGTNSPYSQYGLGALADQSQGFSRGMNGVGLGLRKGNIVNVLNPASYSAIDSLTMIFDAGFSAQATNFKEGGKSLNARNADFEYAVGCFRMMPRVGVSFGILPISNIGYNYTSGTYVDSKTGTIPESYKGSGGLREVFVGVGWRALKPLSIGVNMGYLWGDYNRTASTSSASGINALTKIYTSSVSSYNLSFGLQWQQPLSRKDQLTLGTTVGLGHKLGADAECLLLNTNSSTYVIDTTKFVVSDALKLPMTYSVGLGWNRGEKLFVGADVSLQKWGSIDFPAYDATAKGYSLQSGLLKDRFSCSLGADYVPGNVTSNLIKRTHYRFGVGYASPYYKINGQDGPRELSVSAGFGIPLQKVIWNVRGNMRPVLNISAQWVHAAADGFITENTFRLNLGLTFNERWFAKWRID